MQSHVLTGNFIALPPLALPATRFAARFKPQARRAFRARATLRSAPCLILASYGEAWSSPGDAYLTLGLAHCFEKTDDGKLTDRFIIEPISANSLECMANGARTCFKAVFSLTLEEALSRSKGVLPSDFQNASFCENYDSRAEACARTWMRPHAMQNLLDIVPLGQTKSGFNFDTTDKRVLNFEYVVTDDDNIKQDISIDVYGRKEVDSLQNTDDEPAKEEEDELDSLLAG